MNQEKSVVNVPVDDRDTLVVDGPDGEGADLPSQYRSDDVDDSAHTLERPQLGAKSLACRTLQHGGTNSRQLLLIKLGQASPLGHISQGIDAAFIKKPLSCVHGLPRHTHSRGHLGAAPVCQQHPTRLQSLLRRLAQSFLHHANILQHCY